MKKIEPGLGIRMGKDGTWWQVLEVNAKERTALVIADREICEKAYNKERKDITWEQFDRYSEYVSESVMFSILERLRNGIFHEPNDSEKAIILEYAKIINNMTRDGIAGRSALFILRGAQGIESYQDHLICKGQDPGGIRILVRF